MDILSKSELFRGLSQEALREISRLCRQVSYPQGATIYSPGEPAEDLFVLVDGEVRQTPGPRAPMEAKPGNIRKPGEVFGWGALAEPPAYRVVTATCVRPTTLQVINGASLTLVLTQHPHVGYLVLRKLLQQILARLSTLLTA